MLGACRARVDDMASCPSHNHISAPPIHPPHFHTVQADTAMSTIIDARPRGNYLPVDCPE